MIDSAETSLGSRLLPFVRKLLNLEAQIAGLNAEKSAAYVAAKHNGIDRRALKAVLALIRKNPDAAGLELKLVQAYAAALGIGDPNAMSAEAASDAIMGSDDWSPLDMDLDLDGLGMDF
jgi:uncharacterized protein (UPF0335 family)